MTRGAWLLRARRLLGGESGRIDAEILLSHRVGCDRLSLYTTSASTPLRSSQRRWLNQQLARRASGMPIAYLTQRASFWSFTLRVTPDTLIPRPESELLVEAALRLAGGVVAELGVGSGAIALALASERPDWTVVGCEVSSAALTVARQNAAWLRLLHVKFVQGSWFSPLQGSRYDLIVSNPPYLSKLECEVLEDLRFEPRMALLGGARGGETLAHLVREAPAFLRAGGWLLLEHGASQGGGVRWLFRRYGYQQIDTLRDYGGHERVTLGCYG